MTWLNEAFLDPKQTSPWELLARIGIAFLLGCVVAAIYRGTHRAEPISPTFPRTLVLLAILIAMVTSVIGESVARAFSLVGALSIVRFRTVVRDTQDTAFVIFAVIVGMAAGANHLWVALIGIAIIAIAVFVSKPRGTSDLWLENDSNLVLRLAMGKSPKELTREVFSKYIDRSEVMSVSTAKQGTALEVNYSVRLKKGCSPSDLVSDLGRIEGVQNVDLRQHNFED